MDQARSDATDYLRLNMPAFDKPNAVTYFHDGIVVPTVELALTARQAFAWVRQHSMKRLACVVGAGWGRGEQRRYACGAGGGCSPGCV